MACVAAILGMSFSMLWSVGLISLGVSAFYGIGAYASTLLVMKLGLSFWAALPLAAVITGIIALACGSVILRGGGFSFIILTMILSLIVYQAAGQISFFGGWGGILQIPRPNPIPIPFHSPITFTTKAAYYYLILFLLLIIALILFAFYNSRVGRAWKAIKLSPHLAQSLGINIYRNKLLAFMIGSAAAGAAGSFYAHYFQVVIPDTFGGWSSIYIQLYSVLGGLNYYILGPIIGGVIMTFLPEYLRISSTVAPIITGALLLIIILIFPDGILGILQKNSLKKIYLRLKGFKTLLFFKRQ